MRHEREIPAEHDSLLRRCAAIKDNGPLPKKLAESYWSLRYCLDRGGPIQMQPGDIARLCAEAGYGKPTAEEKAGPSVVQLWREKRLTSDDPVIVNWRGEPKEGRLLAITIQNECKVLLKDDPEERLVDPSTVSLPQAAA